MGGGSQRLWQTRYAHTTTNSIATQCMLGIASTSRGWSALRLRLLCLRRGVQVRQAHWVHLAPPAPPPSTLMAQQLESGQQWRSTRCSRHSHLGPELW